MNDAETRAELIDPLLAAPFTEGVAQAKDDAGKLRLRITSTSNGFVAIP